MLGCFLPLPTYSANSMRIIIAGAGEVGFHLAKLLSMEGHTIVVIDQNNDKLTAISNQLDLGVVYGSSTPLPRSTKPGLPVIATG